MSFLKHLLPAWKTNLEQKDTANAAILSALERTLTEAEKDAIEGKVVMSLETSTGEWLDLYGKLFGLVRKDDETDEEFRDRIIGYVQLERGTIPAIKEAIREFLQDYESYIEIYEPYTNIFYLNKSKLNGKDKFLGNYYTYAVIDIRFTRPFPISIVDVINDFKPAGVRFRLTYRPSMMNPNTETISLPLDSSVVQDTHKKMHAMNGMNDWVRGHLNLTKRVRDEDDDSGIFITNSSRINSSDRLTGAFFVTSPSYNLASATSDSLAINEETSITDILNQSLPLPSDFYIRTGELDSQFATYNFLNGEDFNKFIHFTMDLGTYLNREYTKYLREISPDGVYNKDTYLNLTENPTVQFSIKTTVPTTRPTNVSLQFYNFSLNRWESLASVESSYTQSYYRVPLSSLEPYTTTEGLLFSRMELSPHEETTYCELHLYFFEIGFDKQVAIRPTANPYTAEVSNYSSLIDIEES